MTNLDVLVEPSEVGLDPTRLARIRTHFDQYVTDRRLSGWLVTVARGGELVWTGAGGYRDRDAFGNRWGQPRGRGPSDPQFQQSGAGDIRCR